MLGDLRKKAGNVLVKGMLLLVAVSFVIWGVGDIFQGGSDPSVVAINGKKALTRGELQSAIRKEVARLQQSLGGNVTPEQLKAFQIDKIVLNQQINNRLIDTHIAKIGLRVGKDTIIHAIRTNPGFLNEQGKFDKKRFLALLEQNRITEDAYVATLRKDIAADLLLKTLFAQKIIPEKLVELTAAYRGEKRQVEVISVPVKAVSLPAPSEKELAAFHENHKAEFMASEYRGVTYISFGIEDLMREVAISDSELQSAYTDNAAEYQLPEKRDAENILANDAATAEAVLQKLRNHVPLGAVAKEFGDRLHVVPMKEIVKTDLPKEAQEAVFSTEKGEYSSPVKTALGFHIFRVTQIYPGKKLEFAEVKDKIQKELRAKKAENSLVAFANKIEDEFASGSTMEEAATKFGIKTRQIAAMSVKGQDSQGKQLVDIPAPELFAKTVFSTDSKTESPLVLTPDNNHYFLLRVDSITPERLQPLGEVREKLLENWRKDQQQQAAKKLAETVAKELASGKIAEAVAASHGLAAEQVMVERPSNVIYSEKKGDLPKGLTSSIFTLAPGGVTPVIAEEAQSGYQVAVLRAVQKADQAQDKTVLEKIRKELTEQYYSTLSEEYLLGLRKTYSVTVDSNQLPALSSSNEQ